MKYELFFYESYADHSFCLRIYLHWGCSIPSLVWFEQLLDPIKKTFFKITFWKNCKFPYEKQIFFLGKLYKKFFLFYTFIILVIPNTKFGSLWTTPWPDKSSIFLIIGKAKNSIFPIEIRTFFLWNLGGPFFCRRVYLTWGYSIPSLVWFEQLLDPIKKTYF